MRCFPKLSRIVFSLHRTCSFSQKYNALLCIFLGIIAFVSSSLLVSNDRTVGSFRLMCLGLSAFDSLLFWKHSWGDLRNWYQNPWMKTLQLKRSWILRLTRTRNWTTVFGSSCMSCDPTWPDLNFLFCGWLMFPLIRSIVCVAVAKSDGLPWPSHLTNIP